MNESPTDKDFSSCQAPPSGKRIRPALLRYVGLCLFLVSFFLPAVGVMRGFQTALFGIIFIRPWQPDDKISSLAAFGALLNPEVLLLFFLSVFQRCDRLRALLVIAVLFSIPMTWIAIYRMDHAGMVVYPLGPGHFLWIAGILLIVFAESSAFRFSPARWLTVGLAIVTAAICVPILIGFTMRVPSEADDFHYDQAWNTQNPAECRLIDANAVGRPDQRDSSDFTYMQSDCYRNVAAMRHDPQLCDLVKSGSLDRLIGSRREVQVPQAEVHHRECFSGNAIIPRSVQSMKERPHLIVIAINLLHSGVAVETEFRATSLCGMAISHLMAKKANNVASRKELQGWDEIATFLGLPVATAQRWQRSGMPVRRGGRYVYANPGELNSWLNSESASRFPAHVVTEDEDLAPDLKQALAQAKKTKDPRKAA